MDSVNFNANAVNIKISRSVPSPKQAYATISEKTKMEQAAAVALVPAGMRLVSPLVEGKMAAVGRATTSDEATRCYREAVALLMTPKDRNNPMFQTMLSSISIPIRDQGETSEAYQQRTTAAVSEALMKTSRRELRLATHKHGLSESVKAKILEDRTCKDTDEITRDIKRLSIKAKILEDRACKDTDESARDLKRLSIERIKERPMRINAYLQYAEMHQVDVADILDSDFEVFFNSYKKTHADRNFEEIKASKDFTSTQPVIVQKKETQ